MEDKKLFDKLLGIYFRKSYFGFGSLDKEDENFLEDNTFILKVTKETAKRGYTYDSVLDYLEIGEECTLDNMIVNQSSSTVSLKEYPKHIFNAINFEYKIKEKDEKN